MIPPLSPSYESRPPVQPKPINGRLRLAKDDLMAKVLEILETENAEFISHSAACLLDCLMEAGYRK